MIPISYRVRHQKRRLLFFFGLICFISMVCLVKMYGEPDLHSSIHIDTARNLGRLQAPRISHSVLQVNHIVFLKVHKAASSTMMNMFMRYGIAHNLSVMVPKSSNVFSQTDILRHSQILHYSKTGRYDILCCHVIYRKSAIAQYFSPDTKYIGIVRHPFQQFTSAFLYYRSVYNVKYLVNIPGDNPIRTYLHNPEGYEPPQARMSYTNNRMTFDFGYPFDQFHNVSNFHEYVKSLVSELDFVMIVEYFDESLLMLKRIFGWSLKDILYIPQKYGKRKTSFNFTTDDMNRHEKWANLDYILYQTFLDIFLIKLKGQDELFYDELKVIKSTRADVEEFCRNSDVQVMQVHESRWNSQLSVTRQDCIYMTMEAVPFIKLVRNRYKK